MCIVCFRGKNRCQFIRTGKRLCGTNHSFARSNNKFHDLSQKIKHFCAKFHPLRNIEKGTWFTAKKKKKKKKTILFGKKFRQHLISSAKSKKQTIELFSDNSRKKTKTPLIWSTKSTKEEFQGTKNILLKKQQFSFSQTTREFQKLPVRKYQQTKEVQNLQLAGRLNNFWKHRKYRNIDKRVKHSGASRMLEICNGEYLRQQSQPEKKLNTISRSIIPQKQFITIRILFKKISSHTTYESWLMRQTQCFL